MTAKQCRLVMALALPFILITFSAHAERVQIVGDYCYQYGDSESIMAAKEISYAMALRKAIETYGTFVTSTSVVRDYQLRKDLVETVASGYVENIRITKQNIKGKTVCTELVGYVDPVSIKSIVRKLVGQKQTGGKSEFAGIVSTEYFKILNYQKADHIIEVLYQAKKYYPGSKAGKDMIMVSCYDKAGNPIENTKFFLPRAGAGEIYKGEIRKTLFVLPIGTVSFHLIPYTK